MGTWWKIAIGGALLYYGVLRGAKGLQVKMYNYEFGGIDLTNGIVKLKLNILVKNPLLVGLVLKSVTGDVYVQGVKAGYVNTVLDYKISGGKTHIIPVVVNLKMSELGQAVVLNIQSGNVNSLSVKFDGRLYVGDYGVNIPLVIEKGYNDLVG